MKRAGIRWPHRPPAHLVTGCDTYFDPDGSFTIALHATQPFGLSKPRDHLRVEAATTSRGRRWSLVDPEGVLLERVSSYHKALERAKAILVVRDAARRLALR